MRMKMMKISMLLLWILVLASCSGDFERETDNISSRMGQVTFLFGLQEDDAFIVQTRSGSQEQIARMWYACPLTGTHHRAEISRILDAL